MKKDIFRAAFFPVRRSFWTQKGTRGREKNTNTRSPSIQFLDGAVLRRLKLAWSRRELRRRRRRKEAALAPPQHCPQSRMQIDCLEGAPLRSRNPKSQAEPDCSYVSFFLRLIIRSSKILCIDNAHKLSCTWMYLYIYIFVYVYRGDGAWFAKL